MRDDASVTRFSAPILHASSPAHAIDTATPAHPVALVVAHPDDETIGVGGQLSTWSRRVRCVLVTDGAPDLATARHAGFADAHAYAIARVHESCAALRLAGIADRQLTRLTFPDQQLVLHLPELAEALTTTLEQLQPAVIITHAYEGGHPDHDALSLVLHAIAADIRILEFAEYFEDEHGRLVTNRFAPPATRSERRMVLTPAQRERKRAMLDCYRTQRTVIASFDDREEWLRVAPDYDYLRPPNNGRVWYDHFGWPVSSAAWRAHAAQFVDSSPRARKGWTCSPS